MRWLTAAWDDLTQRLEGVGAWLAPLGLRVILFYEFYESGVTKLNGSNWFANIQDKFPFPFNVLSVDLSWFMATWGEIIGGIAILLGLFTRFFAFSLIIITVVATVAVHWPADWSSLGELWQGYAISNKGAGNYKLPLLYYLMFLPLLFLGPGKLSIDALLRKLQHNPPGPPIADAGAWAIAAFVIGFPMLLILPTFGIVMVAIAVILGGWAYRTR